MIQLNNIRKVYKTDTIETIALNDFDLEVQEGEFVSIMGPSGCGKSTLLSIVGLLDNPSEGTIMLDGTEASKLSDSQLAAFRNKTLGFVFQGFHLINDFTVLENVEIPLLYRKSNASERKNMAMEALRKVGLGERMNHFPNQLSGGQKQRVAIARAIVGNPKVLLADEPTGNLDSVMGEEIMKLLLDLNEREQTTIIMVTHDERMARKTNRIIYLADGVRVESSLIM
jgi:putative ABC transport system ATP-binding protein